MEAVEDAVPPNGGTYSTCKETDWALVELPDAGSCLKLGPSKPCVNKATTLLSKLKENLSEVQDALQKQRERCLNPPDHGHRVSVLQPSSTRHSDSLVAAENTDSSSRPSREQLLVQGTQTGIILHLKPSKALSFGACEYMNINIFDDIMSGAVQLVVRLDGDRMETVRMLMHEKRKVNELRELLDKKARHRLIVIPNLVQKEHEQCLQDIIELNWHVSFEIRQLWRLKEEVRIVEEENSQLRTEVERLNVLLSLINEKIQMEGDNMAAIAHQQKLTSNELAQAIEKLAHTEEKLYQTKLRIDGEIRHMSRELEEINSRKLSTDEELSRAQQENESLCKCYSDVQSRQAENKRKMEMVEEELRVEREKKSQVDETLMKLKETYAMVEGQLRGLEAKDKELQEEFQEKHRKLEEAHQLLVEEMRAQSNTLVEARVHNDELEQEMDVMKEVTTACRKQEKDDIRSIERAKHELVKVDSQLQVVLAQTSALRDEHHTLTQTLKMDGMKLNGIEHSYKTNIQSLKQDLQKEIKMKIRFEAKVMSNTSDLTKMKAEHRKKVEKAEERMHQIMRKEQTNSGVVDKMEENKNQLSDYTGILRSQLESVKAELHRTKEELEPQQAMLSSRNQEQKMKVKDKCDRVHYVMDRVRMLKDRLEDTIKSLKMVCRMEGDATKTIEQLEKKKEELLTMIEEEKEKESRWARELEEISVFTEEAHQRNVQYLSDRTELLAHLQIDMHSALIDNQKLSQHYQSTLTRFVEVKRQALIVLEQKTEMESALRDLKQLLALQSRMCAVLRAHHEYRSHTSRRDLSRFLSRSHTNYQCLKQLKEQFELVTQAMERILNEYAQTQHKPWFQVPTSSGNESRRQDRNSTTRTSIDKTLRDIAASKDGSSKPVTVPQLHVQCY